MRNASQIGQPATPIVTNIDLSKLPRAPPWRLGDPVVQSPDLETPAPITAASLVPDGSHSGTMPAASATVDPGFSIPVRNFEGIPASLTPGNFAVAPPDTMGAVGPDHYVQVVNVFFAIYDKSGNRLAGPTGINCIWRGTANCSQPPPNGIDDQCNAGGFTGFGDGDPDVLYDHLADRWLISQFALPNGLSPPWYQCIAVSQTGDPVAGGWFVYQYGPFNSKINDYPKFGLWPDGYYMGTNCFYPCGQAWAFDRAAMMAGNVGPAPLVCDAESGGPFMLPSSLDGPPPFPGTPEVFARFLDGKEFGGSDRVQQMEFRVDWTTTTGTCTDLPDLTPPGLVTDRSVCGLVFADFCLPQPGTSNKLEAATVFSMYSLQYRTFGDHETLIFDHTVNVNGSGQAGLQWFELRKTGGAWSVFQVGTYSPDSTNRWMGSAAMNGNGDMALGYSAVSTTVFPSIRYAGRVATDPPGTMPRGEFNLAGGGASQTFNCPTGSPCPRWGDYASMNVDPVDDCTFWFTTEYIPNATSAWVTRIGALRPGDCPSVSVTKFFTDSSLNPLPLDSNGNPKVDVVLAHNVVRSTNPGQVLAWVNVTNTGGSSVQSLEMKETLPVDWTVHPAWMPALGGVNVFFANTTSLSTNPEITQPSTITVSTGNPQVVHLAISDFTATAIGHPLMPGQSILMSVKLTYALIGTSQSPTSYPRNYTDTANAVAWTQASFTGSQSTGTASAFFVADAKVVS